MPVARPVFLLQDVSAACLMVRMSVDHHREACPGNHASAPRSASPPGLDNTGPVCSLWPLWAPRLSEVEDHSLRSWFSAPSPWAGTAQGPEPCPSLEVAPAVLLPSRGLRLPARTLPARCRGPHRPSRGVLPGASLPEPGSGHPPAWPTSPVLPPVCLDFKARAGPESPPLARAPSVLRPVL